MTQTFDQTVQRPNVAGVMRTALQFPVETQIGTVDFFGLLKVSLLSKKRPKRVARRMHPRPRFCIFKVVVAPHTLAQMLKGQFIVAFVVCPSSYKVGRQSDLSIGGFGSFV